MLRNRREVIKTLLAGAAATLAVTAGKMRLSALTVASEGAPAQAGEAFSALGLRPGMRFHSSVVSGVGAVEFGSIPVRLTDASGRSFAVDLLSQDGETPGVARTGTLGVYVSNDGDGCLATDEAHGLAAMAIAQHLARREAAGQRMPLLATLRERAGMRPKPRASA